jgi:hypothetical protein
MKTKKKWSKTHRDSFELAMAINKIKKLFDKHGGCGCLIDRYCYSINDLWQEVKHY